VKHFIAGLVWLGWGFGAVSFVLQFRSWRRERRIGPATEKLFEEALRDRQGQYSEVQIKELTELVGKLERAARTEVPRHARRVFLESQLEALNESVATGVRQHNAISAELSRLDAESNELPPEIVRAIDSSITPPAAERRRQVRRLYLLAILILAAITVPGPFGFVFDSIVGTSSQFLGADYLIFGSENIISYAIAMTIGMFITFSLPAGKLKSFVRRRRMAAGVVACLLALMGVGLVVYIAVVLNSDRLTGEYTVGASAASVGLFCIASLILSCLRRSSGP
jgi:hypothetical protein